MLVLIIVIGLLSIIAIGLSVYACTRTHSGCGEKFTMQDPSSLSGAPLVLVDGNNLRTASLDDLIRTSPAIQDVLGSNYVKYNDSIWVRQDLAPDLTHAPNANGPAYLGYTGAFTKDYLRNENRAVATWDSPNLSTLFKTPKTVKIIKPTSNK